MGKPFIADTRPKPVDLKAGESVWWCSCGHSQTQPFCDGSHQGSDFEPLEFVPDKDGRYFLCLCKRSHTPPLCDGSHKAIGEGDLEAQAGIKTVWYKVAEVDELQPGEVRTVQAGSQALALTHFADQFGALDNACPHQGGPLGEGSIECTEKTDDCWLRCPWHGWDFHPLTGKSPTGFGDAVPTFPVEVRADGVYVAVQESIARTRTVSDLMVETMVNWGVTQVFGMVGHSNLGLADALRVQGETGALDYIGVRHEGAAAFAASGYAKLTGQPAACLSIAGPGATNLLTGLWDAKVDRAPVLALTGQVNTQVLGPGAFQEIDLRAAFEAVAGFSQSVLPGSRHAELMSLACKHARLQCEVAHLVFPDEVQTLAVADDKVAGAPQGRLSEAPLLPPEEVLDQLLGKLTQAQRPAIIVGYGAQAAMDEVLRFAERLQAPVMTTFKAKGQVSDDHPLAAGVLGRSGTPIASWCMNQADLLVVFGASFSDHTGIAANKPIVQVDKDPTALGRFHAIDLPVLGDIGRITGWLRQHCARCARSKQQIDLGERWRIWREEKSRRRVATRGRGLSSASVFAALTDACPENAIIAVDVGNNTYSFGRYFECRHQRVLMSGYLGSIGFAFPAAIGAWTATRRDPRFADRKVVAVAGDGGFGQYLSEFTTAVKYAMDITLLLLNNNELGKISKEQRAGHWPVWQTDLVNPNFAEFAASCGGFGERVETEADLASGLQRGLAHPGPALLEVLTDPELV